MLRTPPNPPSVGFLLWSDKMQACPNCGTENPDDATQCSNCGHELKPKSDEEGEVDPEAA
jgi:ribosomal protein L40E